MSKFEGNSVKTATRQRNQKMQIGDLLLLKSSQMSASAFGGGNGLATEPNQRQKFSLDKGWIDGDKP